MNRKRRIAPFLTAALLLALLSACGGNTGGAQEAEEPEIPAAEDTVPLTTETADSPKESAGATHTNAFDFEKKTVLLNNGMEMPIIGIGTFTLSNEQTEESADSVPDPRRATGGYRQRLRQRGGRGSGYQALRPPRGNLCHYQALAAEL